MKSAIATGCKGMETQKGKSVVHLVAANQPNIVRLPVIIPIAYKKKDYSGMGIVVPLKPYK
jgi:hypothetical protein